MKRLLTALFFVLAAIAVQAADVKEGNAWVKAMAKDQFQIDGTPMGKNLLTGYLQELKESKHVTGLVLRNPDEASAEQKRLLRIIADYLQIRAYSADGGKLSPLPAAEPATASGVTQ